MDYSLDFEDNFSAEHGELYGDAGAMDSNSSFAFADISAREDEMSMYTPSQSENSSIMTESKDSRPLTEAWTEEEIKRLRGALGDGATSSGNVLQTLKDMFPNKSYDSIKQQIQLYSPRLLYDTTSSDSVTSKAHTAEGKPPPKKRVPKPKNPAGGFRTGDETRAGDTSIPEEEIIPPDASSDGDYEEPAGGRKRKQSTATKGTAGKKKTAAKTEAGKTTTRQKKPKLSDEPSPAAPSPGGPAPTASSIVAPALYGPDGSRINMTIIPNGSYGPTGTPINMPNGPGSIKTEMPPQFQPPYPSFGAPPPSTHGNMSAPGATGYSINVRQQMEALMAENDLLLRCIREYIPDPMKNLDYMLRFRENTFDLLRLCSRQPACFQHMPVLPVRIQSLQSLIQGAHSARFRETIQQRPTYGMGSPAYPGPSSSTLPQGVPPPQSPTYGHMAPPSTLYPHTGAPPPMSSADYAMRAQQQSPMSYAPQPLQHPQASSSHQT